MAKIILNEREIAVKCLSWMAAKGEITDPNKLIEEGKRIVWNFRRNDYGNTEFSIEIVQGDKAGLTKDGAPNYQGAGSWREED